MHRLLRLVTLWLIALTLPLQGATAATVMAPSHGTMTMTAPCPHHAMQALHDALDPHANVDHATDKAGCCAFCGPAAGQPAALAVAPVADAGAPAARLAARSVAAQFLTGGPDRPPQAVVA